MLCIGFFHIKDFWEKLIILIREITYHHKTNDSKIMKMERVFDILYYQKHTYPKTDCLNTKVAGAWKNYSTNDVISISENMAMGLHDLGIQAGDKIAIISSNRPEWNFVDLGMQMIGATSVPMYPTITVEDYAYIFQHAGVKVVFVENADLLAKVKAATKENPIEHIYSFDGLPNCKHWGIIEKKGADMDKAPLDEMKEAVKGEDLFTIIYTSGTTGRPKGVMLTHTNIVSNSISVAKRSPVTFGQSRTVSFLPLCHIYERTGIYFYLYAGISCYYAENMEAIGDNIREIKPNLFNTVPRLLEKIYDKIEAKGKALDGIKYKLFFWALDLAKDYEPNKPMGFAYNLKLSIADKLIFSKWREALGGEVQAINSGAAALQPRLARIFWAAGIKVCEGYGLTETSPVITASIPNHVDMRIGCVGTVIDGVEIKIAEDGEILCKGENVMQGYYKQPEMTDEVLKDGWFHTGDIGEISEGKYLRITDRKKEMFKTSGGKYIAPQLMENKFKESSYIEQIGVVGNSRKFPSALIVPNFEALEGWLKDNGVKETEPSEIIKNEKVKALFDKEVAHYNEGFGQWEKIKKFMLLPKVWGVDTGELTPTLKLKRRVIDSKYNDQIEEMYTD